MFDTTALYYSSIAATVAINSIAIGFGESLIAKKAIQAIHLQPQAKAEINRTAILGLALNETAAIIGLVISILMLLDKNITAPFAGFGLIGIVCAICLPGVTVGLLSAGPIGQACLSVARQPFFNNKINNLMLVTISFIQTAVIFGFIMALFILYQLPFCTNLTEGIRLLSAGLCIGIGCIGPVTGLSIYATQACANAGYNRHAYLRTLTFTFVSQALIETPIAFALVTSLMIMRTAITAEPSVSASAMLAAALCTGISNITPGISSGRLAAKACEQIAYDPNSYTQLSKVSLIAQGFLDSLAIYGWVISLLLLLNVV